VRGLFVTGTGTGVGKTVLSASLIAAMAAAGERTRAHKPVVTGLDERPEPGAWPPDHELLASVSEMSPDQVAPLRYGPPVSPHLAARLAGETIDPDGLLARARAAGAAGDAVVIEGIGGLLVPLTDGGFTVRDLAVALDLPVVIAAGPSLGTINHTLLTIAAARDARLDVRAVVLTPWPETPGELERCNRDTIAQVGDIEVACLKRIAQPTRNELARAGETLAWRQWMPGSESFIASAP
jgi:dethiobiotin synthetase